MAPHDGDISSPNEVAASVPFSLNRNRGAWGRQDHGVGQEAAAHRLQSQLLQIHLNIQIQMTRSKMASCQVIQEQHKHSDIIKVIKQNRHRRNIQAKFISKVIREHMTEFTNCRADPAPPSPFEEAP
jgi:hypothetical protein